MLVDADELFGMMGLDAPLKPGEARTYVLDGTGRRASMIMDEDGFLSADVTEAVEGEDSNVIVSLQGQMVDGGIDVTSSDLSGESGDPDDPMAAASAFRRLVRFMRVLPA